MPNGHRQRYNFLGLARILDSDDDSAEAPSPAHTSDSETTAYQKAEFHVACTRMRIIADRWRRRARARRCARLLINCNLLPRELREQALSSLIGRFL